MILTPSGISSKMKGSEQNIDSILLDIDGKPQNYRFPGAMVKKSGNIWGKLVSKSHQNYKTFFSSKRWSLMKNNARSSSTPPNTIFPIISEGILAIGPFHTSSIRFPCLQTSNFFSMERWRGGDGLVGLKNNENVKSAILSN